ncbi:MAG TPA: Fic family protein [Rectinemataceae bacterium]|nr:Fic family protein [Rectinemataceae bacterium]
MAELHLSYQLTPRLRALLNSWDSAAAGEEPIVQQRWTNIALWPAARSGTVAGSTGIEGNPITAEEVDEVLAGGSIDAGTVHVLEVQNYNRALDLANRAALRPDFEWSQELLHRLNALIIAGLEDDERGEYRRGPVTVGGIFTPPEWQRLPALMAELVDWLRSDPGDHPLIRAGLTHLNVVSIHPWLNGNGRTARVAGSLMLMRGGIGSPELLNVESEIRAGRDEYMTVLQTTHGARYDPENHSATLWLEYFASICVSRLEVRNRLVNALPNDAGLLFMEVQNTPGSEQWPLILLAARLAPVRTTRIAEMLHLSPGRTRAMLAEMANSGWLEAVGARRGRYYRPGPRLLALPLRTPDLMERLRNV